MKIGIFGGSFNPIHRGHIALARQILRKQRLDEVWLMVSPQNPLKQGNSDLWDDDLRLSLTRKALENEDGLVACDYEFHLPRPSYTWDTLQSLSKDYPEHEFSLIIGADNWSIFDRWYCADDILKNYRVIVYPRDNHPGTIDAPLLDISSTDIRRRVRSGESIKALVPESIEEDVRRLYARYS